MDMSFEDLVRERAYHLWLAGGMADGQAHEHWALAEQAVKASEPVVILTKAAKSTTKAKVAAKPATKTARPSVKAPAKTAAKANAKKPAKVEIAAAH